MTSDTQSISDASHPLPAIPTSSAQGATLPPVVALPQPRTRARVPAWLKYSLAGTGLLIVAASAAGIGAWSSWNNSDVIAKNTYIAGEAVGGLSRTDAKAHLSDRFSHLAIQIQTPDKNYWLSTQQLGITPGIDDTISKAYRYGRDGNPVINAIRLWRSDGAEHRMMLPLQYDKARLRSAMWGVAYTYRRKPKDAELRVGASGTEVVPEQAGRAINVGATLAKLEKVYYVGLPAVPAITVSTPPRITAASLDGVDFELGHYRTEFNSGLEGRTRNIHVAVSVINGTIIMPGQTFSFNRKTGERTYDKGYRMAKIFERKPGKDKSDIVDGLAGGVCQVSSTIFNAVRRTNQARGGHIKIVERNTHSLPVTYVPKGQDATVAWPDKDLRFRNKFSFPIYLRLAVKGERLAIGVWGRVPRNILPTLLPPAKPAVAASPASAISSGVVGTSAG